MLQQEQLEFLSNFKMGNLLHEFFYQFSQVRQLLGAY